MTGGARGIIVKVASSAAEDGRVNATGCVRPFYSKTIIFSVLGHRDNLVF
jgi:hypothetical protein